MAAPMSAVRTGEQFARRAVERKKGAPVSSTRALRAATTGKVAAAETPGAARRAQIEARNDDATSRKPARGKVSASEVANAQHVAAATRTSTPAAIQKQTARDRAESAAGRRDASAGARALNAAQAGAEAVASGVRGLRSSSGFEGRALSDREAASKAKAVVKAIRKAPQAAIDVATAGLRPK